MGLQEREDRRRRWGIGYRIFIAVLILAAATTKALIEAKVWNVPSWVLPAAVIVIAASAFRDNVRAAIVKVRAPQKAARRDEAKMAVIGMLAKVAEDRGLPVLDLGASVFAIRNGPRWTPARLRERFDRTRPYLERTMRVRLADIPQASNVRWHKGKGAIGQCWEIDRPVHKYWLPIAKKQGAKDLTQAEFDDLREDVHMNLTLDEFRSIAAKYAEILAVPVKKPDGQIVGVLSVDLAARNRLVSQGPALKKPEVEELITTAAKFIQKSGVTA
ncbi:hypothetical protein [Terrabacter sp. MAHUQ-38]|uniref:hypothetical protein n=1 Tax=unclassified Terrabacter TaxID=2630222 RepID=UPI00165E858B|nr:hypothetical protein [Terrabacter sp. MAHUQ-38]MBC9819740.1 hypothetical protein [Terrabacter sp. MAHUQ-38]